jgi:DNA-binding response OmpR family regulator
MRILIVDDEPELLEALGALLELEGYEVDLAAGGVEALAIAAKRAPDVSWRT